MRVLMGARLALVRALRVADDWAPVCVVAAVAFTAGMMTMLVMAIRLTP